MLRYAYRQSSQGAVAGARKWAHPPQQLPNFWPGPLSFVFFVWGHPGRKARSYFLGGIPWSAPAHSPLGPPSDRGWSGPAAHSLNPALTAPPGAHHPQKHTLMTLSFLPRRHCSCDSIFGVAPMPFPKPSIFIHPVCDCTKVRDCLLHRRCQLFSTCLMIRFSSFLSNHCA